jgi:hypothetical protein
VILLALALLALATHHFSYRRRRPSRIPDGFNNRILFPFVADDLSSGALDAALRLANAEDATVVPVFLARVSMQLPIDTPLPRQSALCLPLQDAIEQRATTFGVPVDARVERGRTYRHALRATIQNERFDRIVVAAAARGSAGFSPDDVAWLLENAPGEIVVLRAGAANQLVPPKPRSRGWVRTMTRRERPQRARAIR